MKKLISRLEKGERCFITLIVSMELSNARYQSYQCGSFNDDKHEFVKVVKEKGVYYITFTCKIWLPRQGKKFDAKIILEGPEIFFSADCYDNPSEKFELLVVSKEKTEYKLKGFDGRDEIRIFFDFTDDFL